MTTILYVQITNTTKKLPSSNRNKIYKTLCQFTPLKKSVERTNNRFHIFIDSVYAYSSFIYLSKTGKPEEILGPTITIRHQSLCKSCNTFMEVSFLK